MSATPWQAGATCATGSCATLAVDGLGLAYGSRWAFRDVTLRFAPCAITAIVGPSGSGKSSLLTCLNRLDELIPNSRVHGSVTWRGQNVRAGDLPVADLRRRLALISQRPVPFPLSIRDNLVVPLRDYGIRDRATLDARCERALRQVGLWAEVRDRLRQRATTLSGGQQQRLCLARALALDPEVLLLDEPCSALDPLAAAVVEDLIASLRGFFTVVLVTHDLAQARRLADAIVVLWPGDAGGALTSERDPRVAAYLRSQRADVPAVLASAANGGADA